MIRSRLLLVALALVCTGGGLALSGGGVLAAPTRAHASAVQSDPAPVVPQPALVQSRPGQFQLTRSTRIVVASGSVEGVQAVAQDLAAALRPATGYRLRVLTGAARPGDILLELGGSPDLSGDTTGERYHLDVTRNGVTLSASTPHGLFDGVQTIRQLLPPWIESPSPEPGPWTMPAVSITDFPRYTYRGYMLDIARHFEPPAAVERLIDEIAAYKIDVLHLHLSDDQGFRIVISGFPRLTAIGGRGSVGTHGRKMDPGGYWTQAEYRAVVAYAAAHFITVVPEVDTPGHDNAIIMSEYGDVANPHLNGHPWDINCGAQNPPVWHYTPAVGYSALCPESSNTWSILTAIINQLSAMSPGPLYDIGGDEVPSTLLTQVQYASFVNTESAIVNAAAKRVMGWADIAGPGTQPPAGSVAEYWQPAQGSQPGTETAREAVADGMQLVMAPAFHTYLDQKYAVDAGKSVPPTLGFSWACPTGCDVDAAYNWDPGHLVDGVTDTNVLGVEGAMWGETVPTLSNVQYMTFPRLLALAEIGWSPVAPRHRGTPAYLDFLSRLAAQGTRFEAKGQNFYPSTEVLWRLDVEIDAGPATQGQTVNGVIGKLSAPGLRTSALRAVIDWGGGDRSAATLQGTPPTITQVNGLYAIVAHHTYRNPGAHAATLTVRGPDGRVVSVSFIVHT